MFSKNLYYQFNNALPTMVCNQLITIGTEQTEQYKTTGFIEGTTGGGSGKKKRELPGHRKSQVCFIQEQWLFNLILPFIDEANKERVGFINGTNVKPSNLHSMKWVIIINGIWMVSQIEMELIEKKIRLVKKHLKIG